MRSVAPPREECSTPSPGAEAARAAPATGELSPPPRAAVQAHCSRRRWWRARRRGRPSRLRRVSTGLRATPVPPRSPLGHTLQPPRRRLSRRRPLRRRARRLSTQTRTLRPRTLLQPSRAAAKLPAVANRAIAGHPHIRRRRARYSAAFRTGWRGAVRRAGAAARLPRDRIRRRARAGVDDARAVPPARASRSSFRRAPVLRLPSPADHRLPPRRDHHREPLLQRRSSTASTRGRPATSSSSSPATGARRRACTARRRGACCHRSRTPSAGSPSAGDAVRRLHADLGGVRGIPVTAWFVTSSTSPHSANPVVPLPSVQPPLRQHAEASRI